MAAVNTKWIDNLTAEINAVPDCHTLELLAARIEALMLAQIEAALQQYLALAVFDIDVTNLVQAIEFINKIKSFYLLQYAQALAAYTQLLSSYAALTAAIANKRASLHCSFTVPTPPLPSIP